MLDGRLPAGLHTSIWDGTDLSGKRASAGVYYLRLKTPAAAESRQMVLLR